MSEPPKNNPPPLVSIGMPFFSSGEALRLAIQSILWQTFENWELILIDDGSTDDSLEIAKSFNDARIIVKSDGLNKKLATRLNECIEMARGLYFARMDGDDIAYPERLARQLEFMEAHKDVDLVGTSVIVIGKDGRVAGMRNTPATHEEICSRPTSGFGMCHPTYFGRTEWFKKHLYDGNLPKSQDQDLLLRTHKNSRFANIPEILLAYREEGVSLNKLYQSRRAWGRALWHYFRSTGETLNAVKAVTGQAAKYSVECVAVGTGLQNKILSHRAAPVPDNEIQKWQALYRRLIDGSK